MGLATLEDAWHRNLLELLRLSENNFFHSPSQPMKRSISQKLTKNTVNKMHSCLHPSSIFPFVDSISTGTPLLYAWEKVKFAGNSTVHLGRPLVVARYLTMYLHELHVCLKAGG